MKSHRTPEAAGAQRLRENDVEASESQTSKPSLAVSASCRRRSPREAEPSEIDVAGEPEAARKPGFDQLNNRIFFRLFQLGNELQRQAIQQLGISTVQWAVLGALSQPKFADGIPLSDLGEYLVVTRQNLDGVLKRLERDGLVQRVAANSDKRARIVQLTPSGRFYWEEILKRIYQFYDQASARFSFDDRVALVHYLNELQKDLAKVSLSKAGLPKRNGS